MKYTNIEFNKEDQTFEILKGDAGVYQYADLEAARIVSEDAKYYGESPIFSHNVVVSKILPVAPLFDKKVYLGIELTIKGKNKYLYVAEEKSAPNSLQWYKDFEEAEKILDLLKKIKDKYHTSE